MKRSTTVGIPKRPFAWSALLRDFDAADRLGAIGPFEQLLPVGRPGLAEMGSKLLSFPSRRFPVPRRSLRLA